MNKLSVISKFLGHSLLNLKPLLDSSVQNSVLTFLDDDIIRPRLNEQYYEDDPLQNYLNKLLYYF